MREGVPPVPECVEAFLADLHLEGKSRATVRSYATQLQHLPDWPLTDQTIRSVLGKRLAVSPSTARLFRAALSSFIAYCLMRGWLLESPLTTVPRVRVRPPPHRYMTREQVGAVYAACTSDQDRLIVRLLLSGLRANELLALRVKDIDGDVMHVRGKGQTHRALPIDADTLALIPRHGKIVPMAYRTLHDRIVRIGIRAGVPWLRPHDFRRTFSTLWMLETHDAHTLQQLGGWSNDVMVRHYSRSALEASAVSKAREVGLTDRLLR